MTMGVPIFVSDNGQLEIRTSTISRVTLQRLRAPSAIMVKRIYKTLRYPEIPARTEERFTTMACSR